MRPRRLRHIPTIISFMLVALSLPFTIDAQMTHGTSSVMLASDTPAGPLPDDLNAAIVITLQSHAAEQFKGSQFAVTSGQVEDKWALLSIAAYDNPDADRRYVGRGDSSRLLLATRSDDGSWRVELEGTAGFDDLLQRAPGHLVDADAKRILSTSGMRANNNVVVNYKFPWPAGVSWNWWASWHPKPKNDGHDFGTGGPDRRVLASATGTIVYMCRGQYSVNYMIKHADSVTLFYAHIDKHSINPRLREGVTVRQGQVLGRLKTGAWNDGACGYTMQGDDVAHLHWMLPTDRSMMVDGWTIKSPNNYWERSSQRKEPGYSASTSAMLSTNRPYDRWDIWLPSIVQ